MTTLATRHTQDTTTEGTVFVAFALSLRVIMPHAYTDKGQLTPHVHRQYVARFPDRWSRGAVLWALAQALLGSSRYYDALWQERAKLRGRPALLVWGMQEPALQAHQLARWRDVLPSARVVELDDVGHWPHEEAPTRLINAMRDFLSHNNHFPAGHGA